MTASLKKSVGEKIAEREAKAHGMSRTLLTLIVSVGASAVISYVSAVVGGSVDSESLVMPVLLIAVQLMLLSSVLWWLGTYVATKVINKFNYLPQDELRRFRDDLELMCLPMADAPTAERPK